MSNLSLKRINADIKNISRSNLENENIHVWVNDENIYNMRALIIGPKIVNSPYQGGFYFFDINIPKNYPLDPPCVKFITTDGKVRFNPNLYCNGKVCLSVLNTWNGPGWTTASTLTMVLLSLQSILHEHPIQNEPGYENENGEKSINYNNVIAYYNIKIATIDMIKKPPRGFDVFQDIINKYLIDNIEYYNKFIKKYIKYEGMYLTSGIYHMKINQYNIYKLQEELMILYSKFEYNEIK